MHVRFLYASDIHGNTKNISRFIQKFNELKNKFKTSDPAGCVIGVFAGDFVGPTLESNETKGQFDIAMLKNCYDSASIFTLGNHDFNYSEAELAKRLGELNAKAVVSNIDFKANSVLQPYINSFHILSMSNAHQFGFIGLLPSEMQRTSNKAESINILDFSETLNRVEQIINQKFKPEAVHPVIVSHLGIDLDKLLVKNFPNTLIIGGHSHTIEPFYFEEKTTSVVVQAGCNAEFVGVVEAELNNSSCKFNGYHIKISSDMEEDRAAAQAVATIHKSIREKILRDKKLDIDEVVCCTENQHSYAGLDYDCELAGQVRITDVAVIRAASNALVYGYLQENNLAESQSKDYIGLIHAGSLRSSLPTGKIKIKDICEAFPFPQYIVQVDITGEELLVILELGLSKSNFTERGGLLHPTANLVYGYDVNMPPGQRLKLVLFDEKVIELKKTYRIITNDWVAQGRENHLLFKSMWDAGRVKKHEDLKQSLSIITYFRAHPTFLNQELENGREVFGKRVVSSVSLTDCVTLSNDPLHARGREKEITLGDMSVEKVWHNINDNAHTNFNSGFTAFSNTRSTQARHQHADLKNQDKPLDVHSETLRNKSYDM